VLRSKEFFLRFVESGKIISTEQVTPEYAGVSHLQGWAAILKHQTIPFVSYPYEWSFQMLKDAAMLQLDLLLAAINEDMILKDSSPYNIQWEGSCPVFIDIPSLERLSPGEPWVGYRQFCQLYLYPLILKAYKDFPFHLLLRGSIDGIDPRHCSNLMSYRDLFRPGVLTHVYLQAKMQGRYSETKRSVKGDLKKAGFSRAMIENNVKRLAKLVSKLTWSREKTEWSHYSDTHSYTDTDHSKKKDFVRDVIKSRKWNMVWDIGCNTGDFSRIAAENSGYVIAFDKDHLAIDTFYRELREKNNKTILPLVFDLANPSPGLGWQCMERKSIHDRGKPDLIICLALIHHIVISANVPLKDFVKWLSDRETSLVIEFITKDDPMVIQLLRNKEDIYNDYEMDYFEKCLGEYFIVEKRQQLSSNTRILYYGAAKS
jgi:SAM-dependent methyltransferase